MSDQFGLEYLRMYMDYFDYFGYYYGEEEIQYFLMELGIVDVFVLEFEWMDVYLLNELLGIELIFLDFEFLVFFVCDYLINVLVLFNFCYYGWQIGDFFIY